MFCAIETLHLSVVLLCILQWHRTVANSVTLATELECLYYLRAVAVSNGKATIGGFYDQESQECTSEAGFRLMSPTTTKTVTSALTTSATKSVTISTTAPRIQLPITPPQMISSFAGNQFFTVVLKTATYNEAKAFCPSQGLALGTCTNLECAWEVNDFAYFLGCGKVILGITDIVSEGTFVYGATGAAASFTFFFTTSGQSAANDCVRQEVGIPTFPNPYPSGVINLVANEMYGIGWRAYDCNASMDCFLCF